MAVRQRDDPMDEEPEPVELAINHEKPGFIVIKAPEFDAKVDPIGPEEGLAKLGLSIEYAEMSHLRDGKIML